jgi:hypothetical protein
MKNILGHKLKKDREYRGDVSFEIYKNAPFKTMTTYFSKNCFKNTPLNLLMMFYEESDSTINIALFCSVVDYFRSHENSIHSGGATASLGSIFPQSKITAFYLRTAYLFDDKTFTKYLTIIPITHNELLFLARYGVESLEKRMDSLGVDVLDLYREDSVPALDNTDTCTHN